MCVPGFTTATDVAVVLVYLQIDFLFLDVHVCLLSLFCGE